MKSYVTTYNGLFAHRAADAPVVERIEIPIIQRDYAQGRDTLPVSRIRAKFLDVLRDALTTGSPISLDFVYGDVVDGTLRPLDGQQRLTTLLLLHWYVAWRADRLDQEQGWKRFEYATRPSARSFCACLVESKPPSGAQLRTWFEDQHWFLHTWQHDPTIQAMLLMIEAIHERFTGVDCIEAWDRLMDDKQPAISFHLLPIERMGLSEDLYIKMNSRGKPLTPFENFKARFEQILEQSCPERVGEFAQKVDGPWADLLWRYRGIEDIVDDEFLNYFSFLTEVCLWQEGEQAIGDIETLAERAYGPNNEKAAANLDLLIRAFDTWVDSDTYAVFAETFALTSAEIYGKDTNRVVLFASQGGTTNLFAECCRGQVRRSWPRDLLLYAVLLHRLHETAEFSRRVRILRNLIEASSSELRAEKMPALLADVNRLIVEGTFEGISSFNQAQLADEQLKIDFLSKSPALERYVFDLEDQPILRGCLAAFELDETAFERRARAFHNLFATPGLLPAITGALLAAGDYSQRSSGRFSQLGSSLDYSQWRADILTGASRAHLSKVRAPLANLLDAVADSGDDLRASLSLFVNEWLSAHDPDAGLDWRWYFVRYEEMREGRSGIYASPSGVLGYNVCMLDKKAMMSHYRDPYLAAILQQSGVADAAVVGDVAEHRSGGPWFSGYETTPRWMRLRASNTAITCVQDGFQLRAPTAPGQANVFARICEAHGVGTDLRLVVPQVAVDKHQLDTKDRVQLGAALLRDLASAQL